MNMEFFWILDKLLLLRNIWELKVVCADYFLVIMEKALKLLLLKSIDSLLGNTN
jgi:hypothetical protein